MELTSSHIIAIVSVCITLIGILVSLIVWLIRLEGKTNQNAVDLVCLEKEKVDEIAKKLELHKENNQVHQNSDFINYQLNAMQKAIDKVENTLTDGFVQMNNTLNKLMGIDK